MKNRMRNNVLLVLIVFPLCMLAQRKIDTVKVFYLGGQSNMDGYGKNSELPKAFKKQFKNVYIFHGNTVPDEQPNGGLGIWRPLQAGHGAGFASNEKKNNYTKRFGVELSFAKKMQELYPNEKIAIIKYSRGGTSIDSLAARNFGSWDPDYKGKTGINQYDNFLATVKNATYIKDIDGDGKEDYLVPSGILWMQGESDANFTKDIADRYYTNLKRLMELIRAAFRKDDIPVVIGKISDSGKNKKGKMWPYGELVQFAQEEYAKTDTRAAIVRSTEKYGYSDGAHYDSKGYLDLGKEFAEALFKLMTEE